MSARAAYEEMLAFIQAHLAPPLEQHAEEDGALVFTSGDPGQVIVRLTGSEAIVEEFAIEWQGPDAPVVQPIAIGRVRWDAISADAAMRAIRTLVAAARDARLSKFTTCPMCEIAMPPEWMHDDELCQNCARREHRMVH